MKVYLAKTAGFCFGVKNAIRIARENAPALTYGPLIHNAHVIRELEEEKIFCCEDISQIEAGSKVVIRAHGVGPDVYRMLEEKQAVVVDATCPFVKKIHTLVKEAAEEEQVMILGDPDHPEVAGIAGWCKNEPLIYRGLNEMVKDPPPKDKAYLLVEQTTFDQTIFSKILVFLQKQEYNVRVCHTICISTEKHQSEAMELAKKCDAMLVIGGKNSSNTRKLYNLCLSRCPETHLIESAAELYGIRFGTEPLSVGVTAGASTPDHIIQEVVRKMSENNVFEEMLNESFQEVHSGFVVQGKVIGVTDTEIVFNIGYKCDGTMTKAEFGGTEEPLQDQVKVGDQMEVKVIKVGDSEVTLSRRRVIQDKAYQELEDALTNKTALHGKVVEALENGIIIQYGDMRVFVPASLADPRRIDLKTLVGEETDFRIIRLQRKRNRIMGDRRSVISEQRAKLRQETIEKLVPGARLEGTVKNITNYCAFIDLGGIDGMLHISEMGWSAVRNPNRYVKEGQKIEVEVKSYDPETGRISLTTKFPETNPWNGAEVKYAVGNIVTGKVVRFADFGAFVELEKGIDALVHISHLSNKFIKHPSEVLTIGQNVEAKVIDFNAETKRISLTLRDIPGQEEEAPAAEGEFVEEVVYEEIPVEEGEYSEEEIIDETALKQEADAQPAEE